MYCAAILRLCVSPSHCPCPSAWCPVEGHSAQILCLPQSCIRPQRRHNMGTALHTKDASMAKLLSKHVTLVRGRVYLMENGKAHTFLCCHLSTHLALERPGVLAFLLSREMKKALLPRFCILSTFLFPKPHLLQGCRYSEALLLVTTRGSSPFEKKGLPLRRQGRAGGKSLALGRCQNISKEAWEGPRMPKGESGMFPRWSLHTYSPGR